MGPLTCCSNSTSTCPETPSPQMTTGCFDLLISGSVPAIASSLAVVTVFQIVGVILACCLARKVEDKREWYEMRSIRDQRGNIVNCKPKSSKCELCKIQHLVSL